MDSRGWKGQMPGGSPQYWFFVIQGEHKAKKLIMAFPAGEPRPQSFSLIQSWQGLGCFDYSGYWANSWYTMYEESSLDVGWLYILTVGMGKLKSSVCKWMLLSIESQIQRMSFLTEHLSLATSTAEMGSSPASFLHYHIKVPVYRWNNSCVNQHIFTECLEREQRREREIEGAQNRSLSLYAT